MKGKIIRMKLGYNPNSSSLGTDVQVLIYSTVLLSALTLFISSLIRVFRRKGKERKVNEDHQP